jgi:hypothetical protein
MRKSHNLTKLIQTSFSACIILELLLSICFFALFLTIFSIVKEPLPLNLLVIAMIYFVCAFFHNVFMEYLLSLDRFRTAANLEFLTVLLQVVIFSLVLEFGPLTVASSILVSFAVSYFTILGYILFKVPLLGFMGISNPRNFWILANGNHLIGTILGVLDRTDRVLIAFLLPTTSLGQYAAMASMLSYFRFLPEALSKIVVSGPIGTKLEFLRSKLGFFFGMTFLLSSIILVSRSFIEIVLGSEWLLSVWVYISFGLYEVVRGVFQVQYNKRLALSLSPNHWLLLGLASSCLVFSLFFTITLGLIGVPIAFGLCYLLALITLRASNNG